MASLRRESGEHFCDGGIISPYHVLTKEEPKFLGAYVVVGSVSINSGGSKHNIYGIDYPLSFVKEIWMHKIRKPVIMILHLQFLIAEVILILYWQYDKHNMTTE